MGLGCGNPQAIAGAQAPARPCSIWAPAAASTVSSRRSRSAPRAKVIGVDMTPDMVSKARANARKLGRSNVEFRLGEIEHLPVADGTVDVILSNCVINLSPDKQAVFATRFRVLKPGGRLAISDVVALAPLPEALASDVAALTGCVAGAATVERREGVAPRLGLRAIRVEVNPQSRAFIRDWMPGSGVEDYVASATIQAVKPGGKSCCAPACCAPEKSA
jgi:arsenite methyltransferase